MQITAPELAELLPWPDLINALRRSFARSEVVVPPRHRHEFGPAGDQASLLIMPAWTEHYLGVKLVNVVPRNTATGQSALTSTYQLFSAKTGRHLASIDGDELTRRRTVATSALAADYLAPTRASKLLVVGAGHIASSLVAAYRAIRFIDEVRVWSRSEASAERLVAQLRAADIDAEASVDLREDCGWADIVSCATLAQEPIIHGEWLAPASHLDLIGSFTPRMREADDEALATAALFVDTLVAHREAGEIIRALALNPALQIHTLAELCAGTSAGRLGEERTVFKAVGSGLADLAAAGLAYTTHDPEKTRRSS